MVSWCTIGIFTGTEQALCGGMRVYADGMLLRRDDRPRRA